MQFSHWQAPYVGTKVIPLVPPQGACAFYKQMELPFILDEQVRRELGIRLYVRYMDDLFFVIRGLPDQPYGSTKNHILASDTITLQKGL